ncbi:MAG: hypothetical protein OEZ02_09425 [Anaerolineae bacterium]|nr:hypothetical protein [Anaerolineae bacterium]
MQLYPNLLRRGVITSAVLMLLVAACNFNPAAISPFATKIPQPTLIPGELVFSDDFSDPKTAWPYGYSEIGLVNFELGGLAFYVDTAETIFWSNPGLSLTNVRIEVDAKMVRGPERNFYGVICELTEIDKFMTIGITSDGYFGYGFPEINMDSLAQPSPDLTEPADEGYDDWLQFSKMINQGKASNHLVVECSGNRIALFVNGTLLFESFSNSVLREGDVGLFASTFSEGRVDILFDNFEVYQIEPAATPVPQNVGQVR